MAHRTPPCRSPRKARLLDGYDRFTPPPNCQVSVEAALIQLPTIDTSQQLIEVYAWWRHYWSDERMSWDPDAWGGVDALTFKGQGGEIEQIWVPDLHVYETVNQCVRERGIPGGVGLAF